jgi:enoyl-CoA hydratase
MELIDYSIVGAAAVVRINRPQKLNALSSELLRQMMDALALGDDDESVAAIVITGNGRAFSVGADVDELADALSDPVGAVKATLDLLSSPEKVKKPVIAAVNGLALGGGFELVLASDIVIAAETASFGTPEPKLGIVPHFALARLPALIGTMRARDVLLTGRKLSADYAREIGIVSRVVPGAELVDCAVSIAGDISQSAPLALRYMKEEMNRDLPAYNSWGNAFLINTPDAVEGRKAFAEKRKPSFDRS